MSNSGRCPTVQPTIVLLWALVFCAPSVGQTYGLPAKGRVDVCAGPALGTCAPLSGGMIIGQVTQTDGLTPIENATVTAYELDGSPVQSAETWDDGYYFLVVPSGEYVMDAQGPPGELYQPVTFDGLPGGIYEDDHLALATHVVVPPAGIVEDKNFRLVELPYGITVTSPNGGENWTAGEEVTVIWTSAGVCPNAVALVLIRDGLEGPGAALGLRSMGWNVAQEEAVFLLPPWLPSGANYFVEVWALEAASLAVLASDVSDAPLAIGGATEERRLDLTMPDEEAEWFAGASHEITWAAENLGEGSIGWLLFKAGQVVGQFMGAPASSGSSLWDICEDIGDSAAYSLLAFDTTSYGGEAFPFDTSPLFTISGSSSPPHLIVTAPQADDIWTAGDEVTVEWGGSGLGAQVSLLLMRDGCGVAYIAQTPTEAGSYTFPLCSHVGDGESYRILAQTTVSDSTSLRIICGWSAGEFAIVGSRPTPTLTLTCPVGGETCTAGQTCVIAWNATDAEGLDVCLWLLEEQPDGSLAWVTYLGQAPADDGSGGGRFDWTPCPYFGDSDYYVVLIQICQSGLGCPTTSDTSAAPFSLVGSITPEMTVISPSGAESWPAGTNQTVAWSTNATAGTVNAELWHAGAFVRGLGAAPVDDAQLECWIPASSEPGENYVIHLNFNPGDCWWAGISVDSEPFAITRAGVSGRVTNTNGEPLSHVPVQLRRLSVYGGEALQAYAVTDAAGEYQILGVPPGDYRLRAAGEMDNWRGPAVLDPATGHSYRILDCNATYDNAQRLCEIRGGHLATITSPEEQAYLWSTLNLEGCSGGATDRDQEGVWEWVTGEPFIYTNWGPGEPNGGEHENYWSWDPGGAWNDVADLWSHLCEYDNEILPPPHNYARVYYPDTPYSNEAAVIAVAPGQILTDLDFVLAPGCMISGTFYDSDGVTPLPNAHLHIEPVQWPAECFDTFTDVNGAYQVAGLYGGCFSLWASAAGYVQMQYDNRLCDQEGDPLCLVPPEVVTGADFTMQPAYSIFGRVTIGGVAAENVAVSADGFFIGCGGTVSTNEFGTYEVSGLPPGDYRLTAWPFAPSEDPCAAWGPEVYSEEVTFDGADPVHVPPDAVEINFTLEQAGCVTGAITDEDTGETLSGGEVCASWWTGAEEHDTPFCVGTGYTGEFASALRPGWYLIRARRPGYHEEYYDSADGTYDPSEAVPVFIQAGLAESGVNIPLNRTYNVSGTVVDCDTFEPLSGVQVFAFPSPPLTGVGGGDFTDELGQFTIEGLPDGCYDLVATAEGYCPTTVAVCVEGGDLAVPIIEVCPQRPGDFNCSGHVDPNDFESFARCMLGPLVPLGADCRTANFDFDDDVDLQDFALFQAAGE